MSSSELKTLAWDTSTAPSAVALLEGVRRVASDVSPTEARHGEVLLPRVQGLLERAGWHKRDVGLLAVGLGPGSFTGLRVGLAAAKGWAVATGVPLVGVASHAAIAGALRPSSAGAIAVVTDAFKGEVYVTVYPAEAAPDAGPSGQTFHAQPEQAVGRIAAAIGSGSLTLVGDGLRRYPEIFRAALADQVTWADPAFDVPCPETLARLAQARFHAEGRADLATLEPIYVRDSDAKLPSTPLLV